MKMVRNKKEFIRHLFGVYEKKWLDFYGYENVPENSGLQCEYCGTESGLIRDKHDKSDSVSCLDCEMVKNDA
jgi:hypothetical protein